MQLKIEPEFQELIPPLTAEEYKQLEDNIIKEGCRDALVVWNGYIVDGHNRYEICQRHGVEFKTVEHTFTGKEEAKIWIIDNQNGRRNLTDGWKYELKQERKRLLADKGIKAQGTRTDLLSPNDKKLSTPHDTRKQLATELGWSTGKVAQADYVWKHGDEEIKAKVKSGDETVKGAYSQVRREQRKDEIEQQKVAIASGVAQLPEGVFEVIAIDPPWDYRERGGYGADQHDVNSNRGGVDYATMTVEEIKNIKIPAADDAVVFLWTTHKFLYDAFDILRDWGFDYKATIVWDKEKIGIGRTLRLQCEFCLLGIKGKPVLNIGSERDIIREARREHSRKPEAFYTFVDRFVVGRKLDYFSREGREGWSQYGADTGKF